MCQVLKVSPSGFYAWKKRPISERAKQDALLWQRIETIHQASHETYGYRRIHQALLALSLKVSRRRIARLMRKHSCRGKQFRRYIVTTKAGKRLPAVPDLVKREFKAERPNQLWVSDITYVRTGEGWLYLAAVLDLYARRIVGWAMLPTLSVSLTTDALKMAMLLRNPAPGVIHHSDRGSQYTSNEYQQLLQAYGCKPSFGRVGNCYDNAAMESFFGTLKSEWLHHQHFDTREQAMNSIFYYIEVFYNRRRLHSANHYRSPAQQEHLSYSRVH